MSDTPTHDRLLVCFQAIFPDLSPAELSAASSDKLPDWDSIAHVTLIGVIEEEFAIQLPPEQYEELTSFASLRQFLESSQG